MLASNDKKNFGIGLIFCFLLLLSWGWSLWFVTEELQQGNVYRILYVHVPSAFCAFYCAFLLFFYSVMTLFYSKRNETSSAKLSLLGRASAELGLLFTVLTLITGSIWGKPTWGTWWTWDARLTTTFILALLYSGYLLLVTTLFPGRMRERISAVLGILIFVDVPIVYKSVTWWRTLHQPPSLSLAGSALMDSEILNHLVLNIVLMLVVCTWLMWQRYINLHLGSNLERLSIIYMGKEDACSHLRT